MIAGDSGRGASVKLGIILLGMGIGLAAAPLYAQDGNAPQAAPTAQPTSNSIADTFNKAAGANNQAGNATNAATNTAAPNTSLNTNVNPNTSADNNADLNVPPLPTDKESLQTLTHALAADQSGISESDQQTKAFNGALQGVFPLTPEQIKQVMKRMSESQEAGRAPPAPEPKPTVKVENISLEPGVVPPLIAVSAGYVTTVNLLDVTGQPWPIQDVVVGGNFKVTGPNDANVLRIIPQTRFGKGNISMRLVGLSTPVTFRVEAGGPEVYYRYDARLPQSGPGAQQSLINHGFSGEAGNTTLLAVLDGVPPTGAKNMIIHGTDGRTRGYKINDQIYLRTPLALLSPGWDASVRSADGTNVYMLGDTPILMLSDNGQMIRAKITAPPEDAFLPSDLQEGKVTVPVNTDGTVSTPAAAAAQNGSQPLANQASLNAVTQAAATGAAAGAATQTNNNQLNNRPLPGTVQIYPAGSTYGGAGTGASTTNIIYPNAANNNTGGVR